VTVSSPPRLAYDNDDDADNDGAARLDTEAPKRARRRPRQEISVLPQSADNLDSEPPARPQKSRKSKAKSTDKRPARKQDAVVFDIAGVILLGIALLCTLALLSYRSADLALLMSAQQVHNWVGLGGAWVAHASTLAFGLLGFLLPAPIVVMALWCLRPMTQPWRSAWRSLCVVVAAVSLMTLLHGLLRTTTWLPFPAGGVLGASTFDVVAAQIAPVGTIITATILSMLSVLLLLERSIGDAARALVDASQHHAAEAGASARAWWAERKELQAQAALEAEEDDRRAMEEQAKEEEVAALAAAEAAAKAKRVEELTTAKPRARTPKAKSPAPAADERATAAAQPTTMIRGAHIEASSPPVDAQPATNQHTTNRHGPASVVDTDPPWAQQLSDTFDNDKVISLSAALAKRQGPQAAAVTTPTPADTPAPAPLPLDAAEPHAGVLPELDDVELKIVERVQDAATLVAEAEAEEQVAPPPKQAFQLPPLHLLNYDAPPAIEVDEAMLRAQADKLIAKFADFGIDGRIREVRPGPVVTTYEFIPAPGIKVSKVAALADDIAMAMEAVHVRIVAPIPGKGAIGIEIPNERRETVFMKEIIADPAFRKNDDKLLMALGKDIEGKSYYSNLADMPHVLIAGTTGSGKSVSVNAMICSILYRATPDDVKFLMIDPKMLELSLYDGIPHLLLPPIIDSKKAAVALKWAVSEMERRYRLMSELGVRDLKGFNDRVVAGANDKNGQPLNKLPFIVVIIDEYADLLAVAGKDVEAYVMRLAQKARAAGLHVMLATQRPSVDVITGVIKANFPVRMGFRLASNHDSKTIINQPGAEKLLGRGDMLFMPPGTSNVVRVHGAYLSEREMHKVVDFLKQQGKPNYDLSILTHEEEVAGEGGDDALLDEPKDARFDEALQVVARTRKCSTSWLQRAMNLGYQRAARIVDRMEREGLVGPALNAKGDRDIFVKPDGSRANGVDGIDS
jgi:DNA segregation ATPase FtsK/SpoIIIE, S-DNA-T family